MPKKEKNSSLKYWLILLECWEVTFMKPSLPQGFASSSFFWTLSKANVKLVGAFPKICPLWGNLPRVDVYNSPLLLYFLGQMPGKRAPLAREQGAAVSCVTVWRFSRAWPVRCSLGGWWPCLPDPCKSPRGQKLSSTCNTLLLTSVLCVFPLQNMWIERTIYTTAYKLPGILRWFEVKSVFMVSTPHRRNCPSPPLLRSDTASSPGVSSGHRGRQACFRPHIRLNPESLSPSTNTAVEMPCNHNLL